MQLRVNDSTDDSALKKSAAAPNKLKAVLAEKKKEVKHGMCHQSLIYCNFIIYTSLF